MVIVMTLAKLNIRIAAIELLLYALFMAIFKFMLVSILMVKAAPSVRKEKNLS